MGNQQTMDATSKIKFEVKTDRSTERDFHTDINEIYFI